MKAGMRKFLSAMGISFSMVSGSACLQAADAPTFSIQLETISKGYDGLTCWVHPRAGMIPGEKPAVVLTLQKLLLTGSDVFYALNDMRSNDMGRSWQGPTEHVKTLGRRNESAEIIIATCDFTPQWHAASGKLLGIGQTVRYQNNKHIGGERAATWAVYDEATGTWSDWQKLQMPDAVKFYSSGAGSAQRYDQPDGSILLPVYFKSETQKTYRTTVLRCSFDGKTLHYLEHGNELALEQGRGLYEPSITKFQEEYFLTLRNDTHGYVSRSKDGLTFETPIRWLWNDGSDLGNYNTQQHWVTHKEALYLVYTRRGAENDHVFRHRAPLFIAQVDTRTLRVLRDTEKILVPERGARLGNFGVTQINENEAWVTVAEWMQKNGPDRIILPDNQLGADNRVYVARILWEAP